MASTRPRPGCDLNTSTFDLVDESSIHRFSSDCDRSGILWFEYPSTTCLSSYGSVRLGVPRGSIQSEAGLHGLRSGPLGSEERGTSDADMTKFTQTHDGYFHFPSLHITLTNSSVTSNSRHNDQLRVGQNRIFFWRLHTVRRCIILRLSIPAILIPCRFVVSLGLRCFLCRTRRDGSLCIPVEPPLRIHSFLFCSI